MTNDARADLEGLRARLNTLEGAIAAHYAGAKPDGSAALRSWTFQPDPTLEAEEVGRAKHPEAYDPPSMALAIYRELKAAAAAEESK